MNQKSLIPTRPAAQAAFQPHSVPACHAQSPRHFLRCDLKYEWVQGGSHIIAPETTSLCSIKMRNLRVEPSSRPSKVPVDEAMFANRTIFILALFVAYATSAPSGEKQSRTDPETACYSSIVPPPHICELRIYLRSCCGGLAHYSTSSFSFI